MVAQAENAYDPAKGDEYTFFFNYAKNRLSTLKRDRYGISPYKMQIADASPIEGEVEIQELNDLGEYKDVIDSKIQSHLREDYLKFIEGFKIPHRNKTIIIDTIKEIVRIYRLEEDG